MSSSFFAFSYMPSSIPQSPSIYHSTKNLFYKYHLCNFTYLHLALCNIIIYNSSFQYPLFMSIFRSFNWIGKPIF